MMLKIINNLINLGVQKKDNYFVAQLKKAINVLTFNAIISIIIAFCISISKEQFSKASPILLAIPVFLSVVYLNYKNRSFIAVTLLFSFSASLLAVYSLYTGEASNTHSLFILNIIGLALLYQRETPKTYFFFNLAYTLVAFTFTLVSFQMNWFESFTDPRFVAADLRSTNLFFLLASSIVFALVVIFVNNRQQNAMAQALNEQKVLLAEVNHRVKNNLSIIVGLLNLKKNSVVEQETITVLNGIKDRIMSMALVHKMIYQNDNKNEIELEKYIEQLIDEINKSFSDDRKVRISTSIDNIAIDLSNAIPLGLILNELITNSFKHGFSSISSPEIKIKLRKKNDQIELIYKDNGVGLLDEKDPIENLGMTLISGLNEQLESKYRYYNNGGFNYEMNFTLKN